VTRVTVGRLTNEFGWVLNDLELKEVYLHGRRFTWTSATTDPTMTKIDHVFCMREWEMKQPHCHLQALGSLVSDHCPMVVTCQPFHRRYNGFRFESWWLKAPGFRELVQHIWNKEVMSTNKARVLHIKLAILAKALKPWNKERLQLLKRESKEAEELVLKLDQEQDTRH
jgi:hypothetical protein